MRRPLDQFHAAREQATPQGRVPLKRRAVEGLSGGQRQPSVWLLSADREIVPQ
ncbi:hypothetical protein [Streptomyces sp. NPDC055189]